MATVDGRMTTSVGTTLDETAAVANALGMTDAVNVDGVCSPSPPSRSWRRCGCCRWPGRC
ncbi:phosphodiester glycosidase family protein [Streptomyces sp. NPDC003233]